MASDSSDSPPSRKRKKKTKEKKEKKKEKKVEKAPKAEKVKAEGGKRAKPEADEAKGKKKRRRSPSGSPAPAPRLGPARPDFVASGLLDGDSDDGGAAPAAARGSAPPAGRGLAARSRSRDEGVPARGPPADAGRPIGSFGDDFGKGGGKGGKGKGKGKGDDGEEQGPKEEPNFEASGLLGLEDNAKNGVPLKFTTPAEARMPNIKWRIYVFAKQQEKPKIIHIHRLMGVLFGKDRRVVDIPTDHPTCSKQHAVLHHRLAASGHVKPYIMDLESVNGTFLNGERIQAARYTELREGDVLKFGMSSREFVLLHAGSANHIEIDPRKLMSDSE